MYEGLIRRIHLEAAEADIIVERLDGSRMFLEVFCVMPSFPEPRPDEAPKAYSVNAHTQTEMASIRQSSCARSKSSVSSQAPERTTLSSN